MLRFRLRDFERRERKAIRGFDFYDGEDEWPAREHQFFQSQLVAESVAEHAADEEIKELVEEALAKLDPFSAEVVRLHYCDGLTFENMAKLHNSGKSPLKSIAPEHPPLKSVSLRSRASRSLEKLRPIILALRKNRP